MTNSTIADAVHTMLGATPPLVVVDLGNAGLVAHDGGIAFIRNGLVARQVAWGDVVDVGIEGARLGLPFVRLIVVGEPAADRSNLHNDRSAIPIAPLGADRTAAELATEDLRALIRSRGGSLATSEASSRSTTEVGQSIVPTIRNESLRRAIVAATGEEQLDGLVEGSGGAIVATTEAVWVIRPTPWAPRRWEYSELAGIDDHGQQAVLRLAGRTATNPVGIFEVGRSDRAVAMPIFGRAKSDAKAGITAVNQAILKANGLPTPAAVPGFKELTAGARSTIVSELADGEAIVAVIIAIDFSALVATDRRVLILRHGSMLAGWGVGRRSMTLDYANLSGVELDRGLINATVVIRGPGLPVGPVNPSKDWNAFKVFASTKSTVEAIAEIRRRISAAQSGNGPAASASQTDALPRAAEPTLSDQIRDLGRLRDDGLISEEQFESKKQELLSRF
jgi:hypothetical protein